MSLFALAIAAQYVLLGIVVVSLFALVRAAYWNVVALTYYAEDRRFVRQAVVCTVAHSPRWYRVARTSHGLSARTDVCVCPVCGDRWCCRK